MGQRFARIGRDTLEMVDTAPLGLLREIIEWSEDESVPSEVFTWPKSADEDSFRASLKTSLDAQTLEFLRPIEDRCVRIRHLATVDGGKSVVHVAKERLHHEEYLQFEAQLDDLCRSIWMFLHHQADFRDAEAFHSVRQYRDHGKMYDAFEVDAEGAGIDSVTDEQTRNLEILLTKKLDLPSNVTISTLKLQPTSNHRPSLLLIVRHPGPLSSVFHHREGGARKTIYFRPPNEASLVWTPDEKMIEVCGPSPQVRRTTAEAFAEVAFEADLSTKPLTWRYYDLSHFHASLDLPLPFWEDIQIEVAKIIEVEMRLGTWSRRLSLRVTVDDNIEKIAQRWIGGSSLLKRVEGLSRVNISVKYKVPGNDRLRSLEISFGDRRSNIQSKTSATDRELGQRLLQFWGVLKRLKPLEYDEVTEILPNLLELYDLPEEEVSGGHLRRLGLDPKRLIHGGIIAFKAKQSRILSDESDEEYVIEPSAKSGEARAIDSFGEIAGSLPLEDTRMYILKGDWLEETVLTALRPVLGKGRAEKVTDDLISLGSWKRDGQQIPLYLVRRVGRDDRLAELDLALRSRQGAGIGIVLTPAKTPFRHLGPNVVVSLPDILGKGQWEDSSADDLKHRFDAGRWLATGGSEVALMPFANQTATLYIPGKIPLPVIGPKQLMILGRLVNAHKDGAPGVTTGKLIEDTGVRSPPDAWNSRVKKSVAGVYFESAGHGLWRLKTS